MLKRLILMSSSFAILSLAGSESTAATEVDACREFGQGCWSGKDCCDNLVCYYPQNGDISYCWAPD